MIITFLCRRFCLLFICMASVSELGQRYDANIPFPFCFSLSTADMEGLISLTMCKYLSQVFLMQIYKQFRTSSSLCCKCCKLLCAAVVSRMTEYSRFFFICSLGRFFFYYGYSVRNRYSTMCRNNVHERIRN